MPSCIQICMLEPIRFAHLNDLISRLHRTPSPPPSRHPLFSCSRYFSVAASISIAWVLVGLTVNHFQGGIEELLRDPVDRARAAFGIHVLKYSAAADVSVASTKS